MTELKGSLSKKDSKKIDLLLSDLIDPYGDFFITKDNIRLFLRDNKHLLFRALSKGDKIAFNNKAIAFITGFSDNSERKYLKLLYEKPEYVKDLLKIIGWNLNINLWVKIKKNNPVQKQLKKQGFKFKGSRGSEILLYRPKRKDRRK